MKSTCISGNTSNADKGDEDEAAVKHLSEEVVLGDLIWVRLRGSSWWPAQVVDENTVTRRNKPRNGSVGKVLVRLYGSYKYMYVDPMTCRSGFENILKENNGNYREILEKTLEQDLARFKSGRAKGKESIFKGKVRVGAPQDRKAKQNTTKKIQEIEFPISTNGTPGNHPSASVQVTSPSSRKVSSSGLFSENTEETKSEKQKRERVQKKLKRNHPNSVRSSPRLTGVSKPQTTLKNGELLPENVKRGGKTKEQNPDVVHKKHDPNSKSSKSEAARSKAANQDGGMQKKLKAETMSPVSSNFHRKIPRTDSKKKKSHANSWFDCSFWVSIPPKWTLTKLVSLHFKSHKEVLSAIVMWCGRSAANKGNNPHFALQEKSIFSQFLGEKIWIWN
ncbi:uncharacterized protein LOC114300220 isoform X1 [Camellia sinensis]|uniref:uncharacterized protein LOC114300220 isoform X1 n=1 Tax=Camellia sinensis TaxID=4442 RepID=UPI0010357DBB|nr:uncharacterized protein LOC114300220 isoform X1 [Camellia sinensis]